MSDPDPQRCRRDLGSLLDRYDELGAILHGLLEQEHAALTGSTSAELDSVITAKESCVQQLQQLETQRQGLCRRFGFGWDAGGMRALLEWCGSDPAVERSWSALLDRARQSELQNRINGAIGRARHEQVLAALTVLHGAHPAQPTYGASGREPARFERRELARA